MARVVGLDQVSPSRIWLTQPSQAANILTAHHEKMTPIEDYINLRSHLICNHLITEQRLGHLI